MNIDIYKAGLWLKHRVVSLAQHAYLGDDPDLGLDRVHVDFLLSFFRQYASRPEIERMEIRHK